MDDVFSPNIPDCIIEWLWNCCHWDFWRISEIVISKKRVYLNYSTITDHSFRRLQSCLFNKKGLLAGLTFLIFFSQFQPRLFSVIHWSNVLFGAVIEENQLYCSKSPQSALLPILDYKNRNWRSIKLRVNSFFRANSLLRAFLLAYFLHLM